MRTGQPERIGRPLTTPERDVLVLVAEGFTNAEIAVELFKSLDTVKEQLASVCVKLEARSRSHAVAIGIRRGVIG